MENRRKMYSYQRWSSAVQGEGTTKARQSHAAEQYATEHNLEIVEIVDDGISAFKGVNARKGSLAAFIRAVEDGFISPNSILYVESLDRLSREKILKALGLFNDLLELGITIVTGSDSKIYTEESINDNSMDLLQSVLLFSRAHEESKTKQLRTNGNALALIRRFQDEKKPVTIKSIGSHPWWIDASGTQYEAVKPHPTFFPMAQFAIDRFMEGMSAFKVTQLLDQNYPHAYKGKAWAVANVRKLRINPAVYGMRQLEVDGTTYKLENYFPPLITEGQYLRLQQIRETTKYLGKVGDGRKVDDTVNGGKKIVGEKNNINLLSGMRLFRCGHCGGTMMAMYDNRNDNIRYMCEKGRGNQHDCKTWSLPGMLVEHCLMIVTTVAYIHIQMKGGAEKQDYTQQIANTESMITDLSTRISRGTSLLLEGLGDVSEVKEQIKKLNEQKNHLILELEVLQRKQILANDTSAEDIMLDFFNHAQYGVLLDPIHESRLKLRDIVRTAIGDVRAWKVDRKLYLSFQIKGTEGYYNFGAGNTPYEWHCMLNENPIFHDNEKLENSPGELDSVDPNAVEPSELYIGKVFLVKKALEMLETVHYPKLDSKLFWPRK